MVVSIRRLPAGTARAALAFIVAAGLVMFGCSSSSGTATATSASAPATTSAVPGSGSTTSTQPTGTTTPITVPGELSGTATDFCSAIFEGPSRFQEAIGTDISSAYIIINEWVADLWRFAPESLSAEVDGFTTQLIDFSKNLQLGLISTNEGFLLAITAVVGSSEGQALSTYAVANCSQT